MEPTSHRLLSAALGAAALAALAGLTSTTQGGLSRSAEPLPMITDEQAEILAHLSIVYLPDGNGGTNKTIRMTGVNLQLVNGLGATNGNPADPLATAASATQTNGLGNLVIGYQEVAGVERIPFRTGSHNLVLGLGHGYTSFGGLLAGRGNALTGPYASVVGGEGNQVDGRFSAILGGSGNTAPDAVSCWNAIGGGEDNLVMGQYAWVGGGRLNTASGDHSAVGGGLSRSAPGRDDWAAGGLFEEQ